MRSRWLGLTATLGVTVLLSACVSATSSPVTPVPASEAPAEEAVTMEPEAVTAPPRPANPVAVPSSIDATGSRDVADELQAVIDDAPDGSTIVFKPGARYRLGHELQISGKRDLTLAGNGARLELTGPAGSDSKGIQVRDSVGTTIRELAIVGSNREAGTSDACCSRESEHGISVRGARDTRIERVDISRVWGDCLYVNAENDGTWADGVVLRDSTCRLTGRHGVGIIRGSDIRILDNVFDEIGYMVVDIEPNGPDDGATDVLIRGNEVGTYGLTDALDSWLLAACGEDGAAVRGVTVTGNTIEGNRIGWSPGSGPQRRALSVRVCGDRGPRVDFAITDNVARTALEGPAMYFTDVDGVTVSGNVQPLTRGELASFSGSIDVTYEP